MLGKLDIAVVFTLAFIMVGVLSTSTYILASSTSNFQQTINPGTLTTDIVDASYVTVASPSVVMASTTFSFSCSSTTGTFGSATEQIFVSNADAADNGWTLSLAASAPTDVWTSATSLDFNNPAGSGCTGGQMAVDPSVGALAGAPAYATTAITKGSASSFSQGVTDSITMLTAAAGALDIGKWVLTGVSIVQTIPGEQPAASDYDINMVLSVVAS